ncbi:modification methylase PstI (Adenine-specificmethyltransferase PstI) (M.PstI) [Treponema primitia ZAS-2]|uniref:site-specific DNA-methyltransferase (adenine-specific) n=1 Tax=Treponema primitia (strain ATCC BAA-887 / DSM 12427 / ZAS-2) TaxID=545694 RepID=F5YK33_TREPZ|nr:Eco57I restriction-modification methylase domain-containing protein [Treponema primitia]AEF87000.1 modification methylase PstI (Adenine-specificmethyltransferase PstI) (M.PstI) [Treponema primitia ZAS-2]
MSKVLESSGRNSVLNSKSFTRPCFTVIFTVEISILALQELAVTRQARISTVKASHKEEFAQYLTPFEIARYMAELTLRYKRTDTPQFGRPIVILDPGAGSGILAGSLVNFLQRQHQNIPLSLEAWEIDPTIFDTLDQTLSHLGVPYTIRREDFISQMSHEIYRKLNRQYDLIIMNPPYKKINSGTIYRGDLHDIGIETVNTYSAFIAIAVKLLAEGGVLTAIVSRSFCNGLYFLPFRKFLNANIVIRHIHSFEKRDTAFADEKVLQENIIITLQKSKGRKKPITISHSVDKIFSGYFEFSGHTQVNATDLRNMWYPSRETLIKFGHLVQGKAIDEYDTVYTTLNKQEKNGGQ